MVKLSPRCLMIALLLAPVNPLNDQRCLWLQTLDLEVW
jgi:hypothetical protein